MNQNDLAICLRGIQKKYGAFEAVKSIDLDVVRGELFGFIGPNGAGKTTLIRVITGIIKPTAGSIHLCGLDMLGEPEKAKFKIGYVPDRPYLYEKLTPLEHFEFVGGLYQVPLPQIQQRAEEMLTMFGLWDWRKELIESFSHGMKQKVALSASLLHDPDIYIVDEPMVGLDPKSARIVKDFFANLVKKGKTVFLTTHTLSVAEDLCHRIAIINHGTVAALGSLQELMALSKNPSTNLEAIFLKITEEENSPSSPPSVAV
jgi:ABC-2 type transport system ATP-binding protein